MLDTSLDAFVTIGAVGIFAIGAILYLAVLGIRRLISLI